jgi:hypothetical protein
MDIDDTLPNDGGYCKWSVALLIKHYSGVL